jgi:hypothetical protein
MARPEILAMGELDDPLTCDAEVEATQRPTWRTAERKEAR